MAYHQLRIAKIVQETPDARSFVFEVIVALANLNDVTAVIAVLFIVIVTDSQVVGVITAGAPSMALDDAVRGLRVALRTALVDSRAPRPGTGATATRR